MDDIATTHDQVSWWEPYRQTLNSTISDLRPTGIFRPMFWIRVTLVSALLFGGLLIWSIYTYPGLVIPWPRLVLNLLGAPAGIALCMGVLILAPRNIKVQRNRIQFTAGHTFFVQRDQIQSISLQPHSDNTPRLSVTYRTRKGSPRTLEVAVGPRVDLAALADLIKDLSMDVGEHRAFSHAAGRSTRTPQ